MLPIVLLNSESMVCEPNGIAFAYFGKVDETKIKELLKNYKVEEIKYTDKLKVDFKRSSRLLTDEHNYKVKPISELKGIKNITVYKVTL